MDGIDDTNKKLPFEPPTPPPTTAKDVATIAAVGVGVVALALLEPLATLLALPNAPWRPAKQPIDIDRLLRASGAADARAPERDEHGDVECTHCSAFVPYATMSLSEDGYFCRLCAERMTERAIVDLPDDVYKL